MAKKNLFGIFSPCLGEKKDFPVILLDKTIQAENMDIYRKYGEIHRRLMREGALYAGSQYPPLYSDTYVKATTKYNTDYWAYFATDPTKSPIGHWATNSWIAGEGVTTNQRFHIDLGSAKVVKKIYYENLHFIGDYSDSGVKDFTFWGSNTGAGTFDDLVYGNDEGWVELTISQNFFDRHKDSNNPDPKYITVTNSTAYRYYAFKFANNYGNSVYLGVRRIELQISKVVTPDSNPILHYHTFIKRSTAMQYFLAFTKAHIYCWNSTTKAWDLKFTCQSDCIEWDTETYNDLVIATNNVDMVLSWDTTGYFMPLQNTTATNITAATKANPCQITAATHGLTTGDRVFIEDVVGMTEINNLQFIVTVIDVDTFTLDDINSTGYTTYTSGGTVVEFQGINYETTHFLTKAKHVTTFENFLILGYATMNGVVYPQREVWNAIGDETAWKTGDSGSKETEGEDRIVGFKIYSGMLLIFKEDRIIKQVLIPTSEVWNWTVLPGNIGLKSNHSIVEDADGRVYFLANDFTIREIQEGEISQDIDPIVKLIEPSSAHLVYGIFIEETGEIWWSIPYDNALNNKVITLKIGKGWGELNLAVPAFGNYKEA